MGLKLFEETSKKNELYKFDIIDFGCGAGFHLFPIKFTTNL